MKAYRYGIEPRHSLTLQLTKNRATFEWLVIFRLFFILQQESESLSSCEKCCMIMVPRLPIGCCGTSSCVLPRDFRAHLLCVWSQAAIPTSSGALIKQVWFGTRRGGALWAVIVFYTQTYPLSPTRQAIRIGPYAPSQAHVGRPCRRTDRTAFLRRRWAVKLVPVGRAPPYQAPPSLARIHLQRGGID